MQAYVKEVLPVSVQETGETLIMVSFGGSNFKCTWLPNNQLELLNHEEFLQDIKDIKREIQKHATQIKTVIFAGGEPTLQREALLTLARFCKEKGLIVGIKTNGSKPDILKLLIKEELLDFAYISIVSPFRTKIFEKVTKSTSFFITAQTILKDIENSIGMLHEANVNLNFETTIIPNLMYRKEDVLEIANVIKQYEGLWMLKQFDNSQELRNKKYQEINPPSMDFLETIRETCLKEIPQLRIELIANTSAQAQLL